MLWVQVFPVDEADTADFERFITKNAQAIPTITQIEQASYDFRVGYALFETPEIAQNVSRKLNKLEFYGNKVHALTVSPVEDENGILVGPKGFVQEGNYEDKSSRYYPGQQTISPSAGSSKRHTNRRSYQQQQTDPRNFGAIANKYSDDGQPENQPIPSYQQNPQGYPSSFNRQQQYQNQGFDQRSIGNDENQYEKSQSKESKSKSSSRHRKHRRDSSGSSSSSSSDSSYSSPKQSRHKHRHHHHHHRKSK